MPVHRPPFSRGAARLGSAVLLVGLLGALAASPDDSQRPPRASTAVGGQLPAAAEVPAVELPAVEVPGPERASRSGERASLLAPLAQPLAEPAPAGPTPQTAPPAEPPAAPVPAAGAADPAIRGEASWYGPGFQGRTTASGERHDQDALTAASRTLPFDTRLEVCREQRCVVVRVNDRGPFVGDRVLDLSRAAARTIGLDGVAEVTATQLAG